MNMLQVKRIDLSMISLIFELLEKKLVYEIQDEKLLLPEVLEAIDNLSKY